MGYGLQFVRGILVAKFLGPHLFGVWGFLGLVQQYLSYTSLGLQFALNVEMATAAVTDPQEQEKIIAVALTITALIVGFLGLLGLGIQVFASPLFEKYSFNQYAVILGGIAGLAHLKQVFTNVYRVYGKLARIAASELLSTTMLLLVALVFRDEALILALLGAMVLSGGVTLAIFMIRAPFKIFLSFDVRRARSLLVIGIPLLIYNISFYLIAVAGRTIISIFYSVEAMGYYSLASSITTATLLGLHAVTWVVFPSILSRTREGVADEAVAKTVKRVNDLYSISVFLTVFVAILTLPLLFRFLPQYKPAEGVLDILLLSQAVLSITFGYNCVSIARKKQLAVAGICMIAVVIVVGVGLLVALFKLDFVWIAIAVLLGTFVYAVLQAQLGSRLLNRGQFQTGYLTNVLPWGSLIALLIFLAGSLTGYQLFLGGIGLVVFVLSNRGSLEQLWHFVFQKFGVTRVSTVG